MSQQDNIHITIDSYLYIIPDPTKLVSCINTTGHTFVTIYDNNEPLSVKKQECKVFFIENSDIFEKYMEIIDNENKIPIQFYLYINYLLHYIKLKNIGDKVDDYWKALL